ncbi:hypothetical protein I4F81_004317 [Pyropia yezoensis]|uniref:Uncharacterized protein n=1 Tax=Pyropia yezoensis TaxID=2788 RepID=A0ACC3BV13_PYRYE|nr:hypothetical protein I4F81_004317 [Neopyropia yezoensis]
MTASPWLLHRLVAAVAVVRVATPERGRGRLSDPPVCRPASAGLPVGRATAPRRAPLRGGVAEPSGRGRSLGGGKWRNNKRQVPRGGRGQAGVPHAPTTERQRHRVSPLAPPPTSPRLTDPPPSSPFLDPLSTAVWLRRPRRCRRRRVGGGRPRGGRGRGAAAAKDATAHSDSGGFSRARRRWGPVQHRPRGGGEGAPRAAATAATAAAVATADHLHPKRRQLRRRRCSHPG